MLKLTAIGNLTRDPERAIDQSGSEYAKFSVAANTGAGRTKETYYLSCVAFGQRASFILNYLHRGSPVYVDGELSLFVPQDGGKPVLRLKTDNIESVRSSGSPDRIAPGNYAQDAASANDAPVRSAAPIPEGAVDITDKMMNGELPDLPF